jgi:hypothetical protein
MAFEPKDGKPLYPADVRVRKAHDRLNEIEAELKFALRDRDVLDGTIKALLVEKTAMQDAKALAEREIRPERTRELPSTRPQTIFEPKAEKRGIFSRKEAP